jgi:diguanylate cyclase (GGDEF)-like protein
MALLDPRLIEIDILSEADRRTFSGDGPYKHIRTGTMTPEDRQRESALHELMAARAIVVADSFHGPLATDHPELALDVAASKAVHALLTTQTTILLRITQRGRLRLFRLRDEILAGRDRIKDDFGILWSARHWRPDLTVHLRSRQPGTPVSLLLLDVDRLKTLNSELGNPGADVVLRGVFEELRDVVRPHDGYRLGGDEAGAILVDVPFETARATGEEVRQRVQTRAWPESVKIQTAPTVSVGVGTLTINMDTDAFYEAVDRIRARAKADRNTAIAGLVPGTA